MHADHALPFSYRDDSSTPAPPQAPKRSGAEQERAFAQPALLLCRTPLQARICLKIIELEGLDKPDVLYFTQNDSDSDRLYFSRLEKLAKRSQYLYVPAQRFDLLNHLKAYRKSSKAFRTTSYRSLFLASIDSPFFRAIAKHNKAADIHTFDDGTSNITEGWSLSYRTANESWKARFYNFLTGLEKTSAIVARSCKHYSIYKDFRNICPPEKIIPINIFSLENPHGSKAAGKTFFIGQPFQEYLKPAQLLKLKEFLRLRQLDYYVPHPRETTILAGNTPILDKGGELAEIAIMRASPDGLPSIYSCFSTVLINISKENANKYYLDFSDSDDSSDEMLALAIKAGCEVITL